MNPKSFNWTRDLLPMLRAAGLAFEQVTADEWLARLAASNPDPEINPTIKLLDFYKSKYAVPRPGPAAFYETKVTEAASPSLHAVGRARRGADRQDGAVLDHGVLAIGSYSTSMPEIVAESRLAVNEITYWPELLAATVNSLTRAWLRPPSRRGRCSRSSSCR